MYAHITWCLSILLFVDMWVYFYILTTVNIVAMHMDGQVSVHVLLSIPLGIYPEVEVSGHMIILCLIF